VLAFALLALAAGTPAAAKAPSAARLLLRGVALGLYSEDPGFSYAPLLDEIRQLGATDVELVINLYQENGASTRLFAHTRFTATDGAILRAAAEARARGLRVTLLPIVRLSAPRSGEWRGNLRPADPAAWWRSYRAMVLHYAALGRRAQAAGLVIGSELATLDTAAEPWLALAQAVRRRFGGALLYAANWDHYRQARAFAASDAIALSAYFELGSPPAARWRELRAELEAFARAEGGKPLVFTEVGYLSQRGAAAWPWKEAASEPVDLEEQRRCYRAFTEVWAGASSLGGVFFWNWYGWGGPRSRGYTPRGKPAAAEIARFLKGQP
jgi:hypothetical protein